MRFFLKRVPKFVRWIYPECTWEGQGNGKTIYLTFDDGPTPQVTEFVLSSLKQYEAQATFFCLGEQVEKFPALFQKLISEGHRVGNHTYNHVNGWSVNAAEYLENVDRCSKVLKNAGWNEQHPLFRPPYGRMKSIQRKRLLTQYEVVLWSYMTGDFEQTDADICLRRMIAEVRDRDIIVFHDNLKSYNNLKTLLPAALEYWDTEGYNFAIL